MVCSDTSLKLNSLDILAVGRVLICGVVGELLARCLGGGGDLVGEYEAGGRHDLGL